MAQDDDMGDLSAALARAEAAVKALAKEYLVWATADLDLCAQHLAAAQADSQQSRREIAALFGVAHNIKGQGTSFGYPLMTRLGESLCLITRQPRDVSAAEFALIAGHLQLMRDIINTEAGGDGSPDLQAAVQKLESSVAASVAKTP